MAEEIRRRVAALRLAALLAVALTIAGLTTREPVQPMAGESIPKDSVGSRQVIDNSLTAADFKAGELLTPGQAGNKFLKIDAAEQTYLNKIDAADIYLQKVRAADVYLQKVAAADTYLDKASAATTYLNKIEAANTYLKVEAASMFLHKVEAADTYLSKFHAADLYLSKVEAASEYLLKIEADNFLYKEQAADLFLYKEQAADIYLNKIDAARDYLLKIDADAFLHKADAAETYLSKVEAGLTFLKIDAQVDAHKLGGLSADQFVQGDGSVLTGLVLMDKPESQVLMELPGIGTLLTVDHGESVSARLENTSGGPVLVMTGGKSETVDDKGSTGILIGLSQPTLVQLVSPERGIVSTVTLTRASFGGTPLISGQALVGR